MLTTLNEHLYALVITVLVLLHFTFTRLLMRGMNSVIRWARTILLLPCISQPTSPASAFSLLTYIPHHLRLQVAPTGFSSHIADRISIIAPFSHHTHRAGVLNRTAAEVGFEQRGVGAVHVAVTGEVTIAGAFIDTGV